MIGAVKTLKSDWGFIRGEDNQDYFFHRSTLSQGTYLEDLLVGTSVAFEPSTGERGLRAQDVMLVVEESVR